MAAQRDVVVRFLANTQGIEKGAAAATGKLQGIATSLQGIAALGAVVAGVNFFKGTIEEAREADKLVKRTNAVLKSTAGVAHVSAKGIDTLSGSLMELAGVDDEVVRQGANVMLTFTGVRNEVGKGNNIFDQSVEASLNMAAALDQSGNSGASLQDNVIRLGKALNNPITGMTALKKVGVQFTEQQKDQVKALVESGDTLGAQKIILKELNTEFGGMAKASKDSIDGMTIGWGEFAEDVGHKVMPAVNAVSDWALRTGLPALGQVASVVGDVVEPALSTLADTGKGLVGVWNDLPGPFQAGAVALGAWALAGNRVTSAIAPMGNGFRGLGSDVRTAMGAYDVNRVTGVMMAMEERSPTLAKMAQAWRDNASAGLALSNTLPGVSGAITQVGSVAKGVGAVGLSAMKSAASGVMGVLGGPWGIALAGAAVAIGFLMNKSAAQEAQQNALNDVGKQSIKIMQEQKNSIIDLTRYRVLQNAQEQGTIEQAERLGLSSTVVTDALTGEAEGHDALKAAIDKQRGAAEQNASQNETMVSGFLDFFLGTQDATAGLDSMSAANDAWAAQQKKAVTDAQNAAHAHNEEYAAQMGVAGSITAAATAKGGAALTEAQWRTAIEATGFEYDDNKSSVENLTGAIQAYNTEVTASQDTEEGWFASLDQLKAGIEDNGTSLDINTSAGRANRDNLEELSAKSKQLYQDQLNAGVATDVATATYNRNMQQVYDTAAALGFNKEQADALIQMYGGIPPTIATQISTPGYEDAMSKLSGLSGMQYFLAHPKPDGKPPSQADLNALNKDLRRGYADGGRVGGSGGKRQDNIPAWLSADEVVMSNQAGDKYGRDFLVALNEGRIPEEALPRYASGGVVAPFPVSTAGTFMPQPVAPPSTGGSVMDPGVNAPGKVGAIQAWARQQANKRYIWGAVGPNNYDCSGLVGNIYAQAYGLPMYRRYFTTAGMGPGKFNMDSGPGTITIYQGPGHTAANIGGLHAEAYGGNGTPNAIGRVGTRLSYYNRIMHLRGFADGGLVPAGMEINPRMRAESFAQRGWPEPGGVFDQGGWLGPGKAGVNLGNKPEAILTPEESVAYKALAKAAATGNLGGTSKVINVGGIHVTNTPTSIEHQLRVLELRYNV